MAFLLPESPLPLSGTFVCVMRSTCVPSRKRLCTCTLSPQMLYSPGFVCSLCRISFRKSPTGDSSLPSRFLHLHFAVLFYSCRGALPQIRCTEPPKLIRSPALLVGSTFRARLLCDYIMRGSMAPHFRKSQPRSPPKSQRYSWQITTLMVCQHVAIVAQCTRVDRLSGTIS